VDGDGVIEGVCVVDDEGVEVGVCDDEGVADNEYSCVPLGEPVAVAVVVAVVDGEGVTELVGLGVDVDVCVGSYDSANV